MDLETPETSSTGLFPLENTVSVVCSFNNWVSFRPKHQLHISTRPRPCLRFCERTVHSTSQIPLAAALPGFPQGKPSCIGLQTSDGWPGIAECCEVLIHGPSQGCGPRMEPGKCRVRSWKQLLPFLEKGERTPEGEQLAVSAEEQYK